MHPRIHFLLLGVLVGYSSITYAQQAGDGPSSKPIAEALAASPEDKSSAAEGSPVSGKEAAAADEHGGGWEPRDDIYIDDEDDDDDWDGSEGSGVSPGRNQGRGGGGGAGSRRGGSGRGGSSRDRDDLAGSGSGVRPGSTDEEDEDEEEERGSGVGPHVSYVPPPKKPEDKGKKPINPPKEPKERIPEPEVPEDTSRKIDIDDPKKGTEHEIPVGPPEEDLDPSVFMNKPEDRATSFFSQPGILAAVIGGAVVGLLCAILVVMFIVYRMRKKDEGSYALDEPKRSPTVNSYTKNSNREFYA